MLKVMAPMPLAMPTFPFAHAGPHTFGPYICPDPWPSFACSLSWLIPCHAFKQQAFSHQYGEISFLQSVFQWTQLYGWRSWSDHWQVQFWSVSFLLQLGGVCYKNLLRWMMIPCFLYMQLPTSQRWSCFLCNAPAQWDDKMFTAYPDLADCIGNWLRSRAWLYNLQHLIIREIDMPHWYLTSPITWSSISCGIICFAFYILFCKCLKMMGSDKIHTASHTYVYVLSFGFSHREH
jgi:hypothetical protein